MTEAVQLELVKIIVPSLIAAGAWWAAREAKKEVAAAAKEANVAAAVQAAETAALKATQDAAAAKLGDISNATDGTLSALKGQNDILSAANRSMEQIISNFTAVQAAAAVPAPPPAIATVTNGREEPPAAALAQGPIAVFTVPGSSVEIAAEDPVPVTVQAPDAKTGEQ